MCDYQFEHLSSRDGFNKIVRFCKSLVEAIGEVNYDLCLADYLVEEINDNNFENNQILSVVRTVLVDKYKYLYKTINLKENISNFDPLIEAMKQWNAVDIVLVYHHPELGVRIINPAQKDHFKGINEFKKYELITVYCGGCSKTEDMLGSKSTLKLMNTALKILTDFLNGKKMRNISSLKDGPFTYNEKEEEEEVKIEQSIVAKKEKKQDGKKTSEQKETNSQAKEMVGPYAVPVTNELFHNGNVEAWKKIIESYTSKYPGTEVYIFYDGERIHDINTLFKWGKVKHGSSILFSVAGTNISDVAKLKRYLAQGASPRFEDFLRFAVGKVLKLF